MAAKYTDAQLSGMAVNPETKGRMVDAYPHLGELLHKADLTHGEAEDVLLRYLAYVYDPQSPMVRTYSDIRQRKQEAASYTGYKAKTEHTEMVVAFLQKVVNSRKWTLICSYERAYDEFTERVNEPIATIKKVVVKGRGDESSSVEEIPLEDEDVLKAVERKSKLLIEMERMDAKLPDLITSFFMGDEDLAEKTTKKDRRPEAKAEIRK